MLIKTDHRLEQVTFQFDNAGDVRGVELTVNYAVQDDVTDEEVTRVRKTTDVWDQLTASKKTGAKTIGKRLQQIAESL